MLALALLLVGVLVVAIVARTRSDGGGGGVTDPVALAGAKVPVSAKLGGRSARVASAAAATRRASARRHTRLGSAAAFSLARRTFRQQMRAPVFSGKAPDGGKVVARLGAGRAVVRDKRGKQMLMVASDPLQVGTGARAKPVDLSLKRRGDALGPVSSRAPFSLDASSAAHVSFPQAGFGVSVAGAAARSARIADDRAFFANVHKDLDVGVVGLPAGSEMFFVVRSQDAPQRVVLAVDLPAGAMLRRAVSKTPVPKGAPRSIQIVKGQKTLGYVSPPIATDADGRGVPVSMRIAGDRIVLDMSHRGKGLRYPIGIDPEFTVWTATNDPRRFAGWGWGRNSGSWQATIDNCAVSCGLFQWLPKNVQVPSGSAASFAYTVPAGTTMTGATLGGVSHYPYYFYGGYYSFAQNGIIGSAGWERGRFSNQDGLQPDTGYAATVPTFGSFYGHTHNFGVTQSPHERNSAVVLLAAHHPYGYPIGPTSSFAASSMAWAQMWIRDNYAPAWHANNPAPPSIGWTDDGQGVHTRSFRATDYGAGVFSLKLTGTATFSASSSQGTMLGNALIANCTGQAPNPYCPTDWSPTVNYTLNEGANALTAQAEDPSANTTTTHSWTEKIDRKGPTITPSGALWSATGTLSDPVALAVRATDGSPSQPQDQRSGVRTLRVLVDDEEQAAFSQNCTQPAGSCSADLSYVFEPAEFYPGAHRIKIEATDMLGHPSSKVWDVNVAIGSSEEKLSPVDDGSASTLPPVDDGSAACPADPDAGPDGRYCNGDDATNPADQEASGEPPVGNNRAMLLDPLFARSTLLPPLPPFGYGWGIADQNSLAASTRPAPTPTDPNRKVHMFTDPLFTGIGVREVRRVVQWDVVRRGLTPRSQAMNYEFGTCRDGQPPLQEIVENGQTRLVPIRGNMSQDLDGDGDVEGNERSDLDELKEWMAAARSAGLDVVISFEHSRPKQSYCYMPTRNEYRRAVKEFRNTFPYVRWYTAWNEPNHKTQPTNPRFQAKGAANKFAGARQAGRYWRDLKKECQRSSVDTQGNPVLVKCSVGAGDMIDGQSKTLGQFFTEYVKGLDGQEPSVWAYHAYSAGYAGRDKTGAQRKHSSDRLARFMAATRYSSKTAAKVWLTEQGGQYHVHRDPAWDGLTAASAEAAANEDLKFLLTLPYKELAERRITRFFAYSWLGAPETNGPGSSPFDSGLLDVNDAKRTRSMYTTFKNRVAGTP